MPALARKVDFSKPDWRQTFQLYMSIPLGLKGKGRRHAIMKKLNRNHLAITEIPKSIAAGACTTHEGCPFTAGEHVHNERKLEGKEEILTKVTPNMFPFDDLTVDN